MLYSIIVALFPILNIFKAPFINMGLSTVLSFAMFYIALLTLPFRKKTATDKMKPLIPFIAYIFIQFALMIIIGTNGDSDAWKGLVLMVFNIMTFLCFLEPKFNLNIARKTVEFVSLIAVICIIVQVIMNQLFNIEILRLPESIVYLSREEEMTDKTGLFRASAFFLEPSHFTQYVIIGLASVLFREKGEKPQIYKALFFSLGILISTSGIGIVLCAFVWIMYTYMKHSGGSKRKSFARIIYLLIGVAILAFIALILYQFIPVFRNSLDRILGRTDYDPIRGRTWSYVIYERLPLVQKIFGVGYANSSGYYMTGLIESLYGIGLFGTVILLYSFFKYYLLTKENDFSKMVLLIIIAMFPVTRTFTFAGIVFYFSFVVCGINNNRKKSTRKNYLNNSNINQKHSMICTSGLGNINEK